MLVDMLHQSLKQGDVVVVGKTLEGLVIGEVIAVTYNQVALSILKQTEGLQERSNTLLTRYGSQVLKVAEYVKGALRDLE